MIVLAESQIFTDTERLKIMDKIAINLMLRDSLKIRLRCSGGNGTVCVQEINVLTYGGDQKLIHYFVQTAQRQRLRFGYRYAINEGEDKNRERLPFQLFDCLPISPDTVPKNSVVLLAEYRNNRCESIYFIPFRKPWPSDKIIFGIFDQHNLDTKHVTHCPCGLRWDSLHVRYNGNVEMMQHYKRYR